MTEQEVKEGNELIVSFMGLKAELVEIDREFDEPIYKVYSDTHLFFDRFRINYVALEQGFDETNPLIYFYKMIKLKYHSDWNWLMSVINKIVEIDITPVPNWSGYRIEIVPRGYVEISGFPMSKINTNVSIEGSLINATYKAVITFIKWYNDNK